jgi:hypothetical protein
MFIPFFVVDAGLHRKSRKTFKSSEKPGKNLETNFNFCLPWDEFSKFLPTDRSKGRLTGLWTSAFYNNFHKKFPSCAIVFSGNRLRNVSSRKRNARIWFARAACKVKGCIKACFSIQDLPKPGFEVTVTVDITGRCIHDASAAEIDSEKGIEVATVNVRRPLSGTERAKTVDTLKLLRTESKSLYFKKLSAMKSDELAAGNTTECQTPQVIRQALYETSVKQRLSPDVFQELVIQKECWDVALRGGTINGFIQSLCHTPFYVTFYTKQQAEIYVNSCFRNSTRLTVLHFDSTGSVVKKFPDNKPPYY